MIRDQEELLLSVQDDLSRDYLREAVRCYNAGAFRAAVVLAVAACMDDLYRKLVQLKNSGAGSEIAGLASKIEGKLKTHEAFEQLLLNGCKGTDVLSPAEYEKLVTVLKIRHLCAHPTGHAGSPEEARDVIASCVDLVLSRPAQVGGAEIEALVTDRLGHSNYFGVGGQKAVAATVAAELARFRANALKGLASRLVKVIAEEPAATSQHRHAVEFLGAMARSASNVVARRHAWEAVGKLLASSGSESVLPILRDDPAGLAGVEPVVRLRALGLVRASLKNPVAQATLSAWIGVGVLDEEERKDFLSRIKTDVLFFSASAARDPDAARGVVAAAATLVTNLEWDELWNEHIEWLIASAAHGNFHVENAVIKHLRDLPDHEARQFTDDQRARAVMQIIRAAEHGAWEGESVCKGGLSKRPEFVEVFVAALRTGRAEYSPQSWDWTERLLVNSGLPQAAVEVATGIVAGAIGADKRDGLVRYLRSSDVPEIRDLAPAGQESGAEGGRVGEPP